MNANPIQPPKARKEDSIWLPRAKFERYKDHLMREGFACKEIPASSPSQVPFSDENPGDCRVFRLCDVGIVPDGAALFPRMELTKTTGRHTLTVTIHGDWHSVSNDSMADVINLKADFRCLSPSQYLINAFPDKMHSSHTEYFARLAPPSEPAHLRDIERSMLAALNEYAMIVNLPAIDAMHAEIAHWNLAKALTDIGEGNRYFETVRAQVHSLLQSLKHGIGASERVITDIRSSHMITAAMDHVADKFGLK